MDHCRRILEAAFINVGPLTCTGPGGDDSVVRSFSFQQNHQPIGSALVNVRSILHFRNYVPLCLDSQAFRRDRDFCFLNLRSLASFYWCYKNIFPRFMPLLLHCKLHQAWKIYCIHHTQTQERKGRKCSRLLAHISCPFDAHFYDKCWFPGKMAMLHFPLGKRDFEKTFANHLIRCRLTDRFR